MATHDGPRADTERPATDAAAKGTDLDPALERLTDLERRSLLAEQARQQAHRLRTPLSVIDLIAEALRQQSRDDPARADRLARIQGAIGTLTTELRALVSSTAFGDGPRQRLDPIMLAAKVVETFGGELAPAPACAEGLSATVERASLEAAVVHALRLVGVGTDCNGICTQRPKLRAECRDGELILMISAVGTEVMDIPRDRADLRLMAKAAERFAQDHRGSLTLGPDTATFRLPLADG